MTRETLFATLDRLAVFACSPFVDGASGFASFCSAASADFVTVIVSIFPSLMIDKHSPNHAQLDSCKHLSQVLSNSSVLRTTAASLIDLLVHRGQVEWTKPRRV